MNSPPCSSFGDRSTDSLLYRKLIHQWLNQPNSQPLGIDISTNVLKKPKGYRGMNRITGTKVDDASSSHAVLVIGRRKDPKTGNCQFLVRNSWGEECLRYAKEWTCDAGNGGNVWVDAEDLSENIFGLWAIGGVSGILQ